MDLKKRLQILSVAAIVVALISIWLTTGNQVIYLFWLLIPVTWLAVSKKPEEIGITKTNISKAIIFGLVVGIFVGSIKYFSSSQMPWLISGFLKYTAEYVPKVGILTYIVMIIVGDAIRELFYRGFIQTRFMKRFSPVIAIFFTAILLGLTDQIEGVYSIIDATANGIISGYLFYRTKNLAASIVFMPTVFIIILLLSSLA